MRKLLAIVLCILCLSPMAEASEEKFVALTFDDGPSGRVTRRRVEGLEARIGGPRLFPPGLADPFPAESGGRDPRNGRTSAGGSKDPVFAATGGLCHRRDPAGGGGPESCHFELVGGPP